MSEPAETKKRRGRPPKYIYPINCEHCGDRFDLLDNYYCHRDEYKLCVGSKKFDMSAVEKKVKSGDMSYPLITFNPTSGINSGLSDTSVVSRSWSSRRRCVTNSVAVR